MSGMNGIIKPNHVWVSKMNALLSEMYAFINARLGCMTEMNGFIKLNHAWMNEMNAWMKEMNA
jgi:hypothetical protein